MRNTPPPIRLLLLQVVIAGSHNLQFVISIPFFTPPQQQYHHHRNNNNNHSEICYGHVTQTHSSRVTTALLHRIDNVNFNVDRLITDMSHLRVVALSISSSYIYASSYQPMIFSEDEFYQNYIRFCYFMEMTSDDSIL